MTSSALDSTLRLRRVTALIGPYGSGKTELSIGLAQYAAHTLVHPDGPIRRVMLGDLDVLKPYFRSREAGARLLADGVGILAPGGALASSDLPIISAELRGTVGRTDTALVLDVGGDPVGARALGSVSDVLGRVEHDLLLVLNRHRPFMDPLDKVLATAALISGAAQLRITGVVSNTHMMDETTVDDVWWGLELSRQVAAHLGVDVRLLALPDRLLPQLRETAERAGPQGLPPVVTIHRHMMPAFLGGVVFEQTAAPDAFRSLSA